MVHMTKKMSAVATAIVLVAGCGKSDSESNSDPAPTEAKMTGQLALTSTTLLGISDSQVYCVSFSDTPSATKGDLDADGKFSMTMKTNSPFGCFVVKKSDNSVEATFVVKGTAGGPGSANTQQISLAGDVELGKLEVKNGKVEVDAKLLAGKTTDSSTSASKFTDINGKTYKISCIVPSDSSDKVQAAQYASCKESMESSPPVYWETFEGTKGTETVYAIAAWASKAAREACGVNMSTAEYTDHVAADGYAFPSLKVGTFAANAYNYEANPNSSGKGSSDSKCEYEVDNSGKKTSGDGDKTKIISEDILQLHVLSEAKMVPNGFSARSYEENTYGTAASSSATVCKSTHETEFIVTWTTDAELAGAFTFTETRSDCEKSGTHTTNQTFPVKFVKQ